MSEDNLNGMWRNLIENQNSDGGWGYFPGKISSTEPTVLSLMAICFLRDRQYEEAAVRGIEWLLDAQNEDGSWPTWLGDKEPSWTTPLALLSLNSFNKYQNSCKRGADYLLGAYGEQISDPGPTRLDGSLRGWPWYRGTFSWIEPTSYALIALKKMRPYLDSPDAVEYRILEAEKLLIDRMCSKGGWNYGNSNVMDAELDPFLPPTAIALIALQDNRELPEVELSLERLKNELRTQSSGLILGWAILCFHIFGVPYDELQEKLERIYVEGRFLGSICTTALAAFSLQVDKGPNFLLLT